MNAPEISAPENLEVHRFTIDADDYVALSFPLPSLPRGALPPAQLTESERDVCALVLEGRSNQEIARLRGTSPRTIANQVACVYRKLGIGSRRELRARKSSVGRSA